MGRLVSGHVKVKMVPTFRPIRKNGSFDVLVSRLPEGISLWYVRIRIEVVKIGIAIAKPSMRTIGLFLAWGKAWRSSTGLATVIDI